MDEYRPTVQPDHRMIAGFALVSTPERFCIGGPE
jgi:hypothetical protein